MNIFSDTNYRYLTYNINLVKQYVQKDDEVKDSLKYVMRRDLKDKVYKYFNTCSKSIFLT